MTLAPPSGPDGLDVAPTAAPPGRHIVAELGLRVEVAGADRHGFAEIVPAMCVPGTSLARTSVLATFADVIAGTVAGQAVHPRIPLTLDLELQLHGPVRAGDRLELVSTPVKTGRTVTVCETTFRNTRTGDLTATSFASFIASPNPAHVFADGFPRVLHVPDPLRVPLAERIGSARLAPGTAEVPKRPDGLNASGAIQGGIVAFAAEEAVLSLLDHPTALSSLTVRYLRPVSTGPGRATAEVHGRAATVRIVDAGTGKLCTLATARLPG